MQRLKPVVFFLFLLSFLSVKGQEKVMWYDQDLLLNKGVFKNYGLVTEPKEIGIVLYNPSPAPKRFFLKINNPHINKIYVINSKKDTLYTTGDRYPFNSRPIYFWEYIFPFEVQPNTIDSIKFQLDKSGETFSYHALLMNEATFGNVRDANLFFYSTFLAVSIFLFFIFVFIGFYKQDKKHVLFAGFIFISAGWALNERGIFFQYIWPNNTALQERLDTFFATPSLGLVVFILFFNETYKGLIEKKVKGILIFFLSFLIIRTILVFVYPELIENADLKYNLLRTSNIIVISVILFFLYYLIQFGLKRILLLDTIGFIAYFLYLLKLALKSNNLDFVLTERFHGFAYPLMQTVTIAIFSLSSYLKYRNERKQKQLEEKNFALLREKEMTEKILAVQENEREIIGRNIHDQVGGLLATAKIKLQTIKLKNDDSVLKEDIDHIINIMNRSSAEVYQIIDDLVPPIMKGETLANIIQSRIAILEKSTDIHFRVEMEPVWLEQNVMLKLYRILSELMTNSIKHAKCKNITINFTQAENGFTLDYIDDGIGFNKDSPRNHGINNIESRVKYLDGTLHFYSVPGKTHYSIYIPQNKHEK